MINLKKAIRQYQLQRRHAEKVRNIKFDMTFEEWYDIWQQSGHWDKRGRGKGKYVMSRYGDKGPYAVGNVFINLHELNTIEANLNRPCSLEKKEKIRLANTGKKRTIETKLKIAKNSSEHRHSDETKIKMSLTRKGKKQPLIVCVHCNKEGGLSSINRWHNNNCKLKI